MGRRSCCAKEGLNRGAWTVMEDKILTNYIKAHGEGKWRELPLKTGLKRCRKSCRLRWLNYLRPDIKRGNISTDEEELIVRLHKLLGNRWSLIAGRLPGRTDNEIKNYWNTVISKKKVLRDDKVPLSTKKKNKLDNLKIKVGDNNHRPHQVIRTKAFRCTTAVTILPRQPPLLDADKIINNFDSPEVYVNNNGGNPLKDNYNNNNNGGGDSWVLFGEHDNLLMDSHISDMLLPDNYEMVINNWEKNTASPEVYVNNNGGNPLKDNCNNNNYGGGDSWGLFGEDDNLLMDFDVSDLILPDNYEMVINNWEENTASPQLIGDFDFLSLEKFLGHEEEWKLDDDA